MAQPLLPVCLAPLFSISKLEFLSIDLEELIGFLRMGPGDVMEGRRRDVVILTFSNQRVILDQILQLGVVAF